MAIRENPQQDQSSGVGEQNREPKTPNGGLNEEIGELEPDAAEDEDELPGKAGGGLVGG